MARPNFIRERSAEPRPHRFREPMAPSRHLFLQTVNGSLFIRNARLRRYRWQAARLSAFVRLGGNLPVLAGPTTSPSSLERGIASTFLKFRREVGRQQGLPQAIRPVVNNFLIHMLYRADML